MMKNIFYFYTIQPETETVGEDYSKDQEKNVFYLKRDY